MRAVFGSSALLFLVGICGAGDGPGVAPSQAGRDILDPQHQSISDTAHTIQPAAAAAFTKSNR